MTLKSASSSWRDASRYFDQEFPLKYATQVPSTVLPYVRAGYSEPYLFGDLRIIILLSFATVCHWAAPGYSEQASENARRQFLHPLCAGFSLLIETAYSFSAMRREISVYGESNASRAERVFDYYRL